MAFLGQTAAVAQQYPIIGKIVSLDKRFDSMVRSDANIEVLADGFTWTEGPVWRGTNDEGHLLFSDIPRNTIFKWDPNYGVSVFLTPSGYTGNTYYGLEPGSN
ncbi:MAG: SMP-30/gluconolactonase/LRE family protein, partial [Planctomycetota bacterium]